LKKEFPLTDEWVAYELRPEMPLEGMPMSKIFPGVDLKKRYESLSHAGSPYGISLNEISRASNSRLALEASEYARDKGHFDSFHGRVFRAYFVETRDIGNLEVILGLASEDGLDDDDLRRALKEKQYAARLEEAKDEARGYGITAVPTFIINGKHKLVGAKPIEAFRDKFRIIQAE
jgi:predicted DsbA family dithiol-disulfide isomerase